MGILSRLVLTIFIVTSLGSVASSNGVPESGVLSFDIIRNGDAIGTHTYRFDRSGDRTEVRISTDIDVCFSFRSIVLSMSLVKSGKTDAFLPSNRRPISTSYGSYQSSR